MKCIVSCTVLYCNHCTWKKLQISLLLNIVGNIWDNVSAQLNKVYNIGPVIFRHFNVEMLLLYL